MATIFNLNLKGSGQVGTSLWIDLGAIPAGFKIWVGNAQYTSPSKSVTFEIRANIPGQSAGTTGATTLLDTVSVSPKSGTLTRDLYKNGRLHVATIVGSGVERWWLRLTSKSGALGDYLYSLNYTTE
jgi:hypothetical protein